MKVETLEEEIKPISQTEADGFCVSVFGNGQIFIQFEDGRHCMAHAETINRLIGESVPGNAIPYDILRR